MLDRKLQGRDFIKRPTCPFCGVVVERPLELTTRRQGEMPVGRCACGAVYACDESGRNVGSAQIEALVFGCDMDWDLAWSLLPEEDYRQEIVEHYDLQNHLIVPGAFLDSRRIAGVLVFVRLHDDVLEVTAEGVRKRLDRATPVPSAAPAAQARVAKTPSLSKRDVEARVRAYDLEPLVEAASADRKLLRTLQRLLYTGEDELRRLLCNSRGASEAGEGGCDHLSQGAEERRGVQRHTRGDAQGRGCDGALPLLARSRMGSRRRGRAERRRAAAGLSQSDARLHGRELRLHRRLPGSRGDNALQREPADKQ